MKILPYKHRTSCCLCGSSGLELVCEITELPYQSPNVGVNPNAQDVLSDSDILVPLDLYLCKSCFHLQLADIINPEIQYSNYRYQTSITLGLATHFRSTVDKIETFIGRDSNALKVLDIGSNDGTLLRYFQERGGEVLGVEPAVEISRQARNNGIPTITAFFSAQSASAIVSNHNRFDVISANYVFANIEHLDGFVDGIKLALKSNGVFVFETQYGVDVIERFLIDTIYHEHISYFNVAPLAYLFDRHDMKIVDVQRIPTKGGSIRVFVSHSDGEFETKSSVDEFISLEKESGFQSDIPFRAFSEQLEGNRQAVANFLSSATRVAGYGASVGTMTLLHFYGLTNSIRYICDDSPMQSFLRGPSYEIPIVGAAQLYEDSVEAVLLFAWRYAENIISNHKVYLERGGRFIVPLPQVQQIDRM